MAVKNANQQRDVTTNKRLYLFRNCKAKLGRYRTHKVIKTMKIAIIQHLVYHKLSNYNVSTEILCIPQITNGRKAEAAFYFNMEQNLHWRDEFSISMTNTNLDWRQLENNHLAPLTDVFSCIFWGSMFPSTTTMVIYCSFRMAIIIKSQVITYNPMYFFCQILIKMRQIIKTNLISTTLNRIQIVLTSSEIDLNDYLVIILI